MRKDRPTNNGSESTVPLRLLLVEDHADTANLLSRILVAAGYTVVIARTAATALELAAVQQFDLILSDVGLPDESGYELMRRIQAIRPLKGIAMSGYGTDEDIHMSQQAGFIEHITKPVDVEQLQQAIKRVVEVNRSTSND